jgi:hypothetical protein
MLRVSIKDIYTDLRHKVSTQNFKDLVSAFIVAILSEQWQHAPN